MTNGKIQKTNQPYLKAHKIQHKYQHTIATNQKNITKQTASIQMDPTYFHTKTKVTSKEM